jgi:Cu-Zn family superoxide dismutase
MKTRIMAAAIVACAIAWLGARAAGQAGTVITLKDAKGEVVGKAGLSATPGGGLQISLDIQKLPPGEHAIHVHAVAKCEGPDFATAGGHFNPAGKKHGLQNPEGPHAGDMNNFTVDKDGKATRVIDDPRLTLGSEPTSVFTGGGTALVIHAAADDMHTDPSGNSGARIACGIIVKQ